MTFESVTTPRNKATVLTIGANQTKKVNLKKVNLFKGLPILSLKIASVIKDFIDQISAPSISSNTVGFSEVRDLMIALQKLDGVEQVRAIADNPGDLHSLVFELKVSSLANNSESRSGGGTLWEKAEDLVIEAEWNLRRSTGEQWCFESDLVCVFGDCPKGIR